MNKNIQKLAYMLIIVILMLVTPVILARYVMQTMILNSSAYKGPSASTGYIAEGLMLIFCIFIIIPSLIVKLHSHSREYSNRQSMTAPSAVFPIIISMVLIALLTFFIVMIHIIQIVSPL